MAKNLVYRNDDKNNRVEDLGRTIAPGSPVLSKAGTPAVAVTGSADYVAPSYTLPGGGTVSNVPWGGQGLKDKEVTLAFDGTWEFLASEFDGSTPDPDNLAQGTAINYVVADNKLTTAAIASGIVAFGTVDFPPDYDKSRGYVPVKIGA